MKFDILEKLDDGDILKISKAVISVDPDAKVDTDMRENTVNVESWLYPEEFLVAFFEVGYDVRIAQR
ncbi:copper chaperone [Paraburkholderia denitrificans]|uniref:Copper chaperone n=1 Tax=Paraburkholderia denitrificans TaxID=694025 RepID=A0ABW0JFG7_9BURK